MSDGTNSGLQRAAKKQEGSAELRLAWSRAQEFLTEQEAYVLGQRLFVAPDSRPLAFAKIGNAIGLSSQRVHEIYRRACDKVSVRADTWAVAEQLLNRSSSSDRAEDGASASMATGSVPFDAQTESSTDWENASVEELAEDEGEAVEDEEDEPEEELPEDLHELLQATLDRVTTALPLCLNEGLDQVVRILSSTQHRIRLGLDELKAAEAGTMKRNATPVLPVEPIEPSAPSAPQNVVHHGIAQHALRSKVNEAEKARRMAMHERVLRGELSHSAAARELGIKRSTWQAWVSYEPRRKPNPKSEVTPSAVRASSAALAAEMPILSDTTTEDAPLPKPQPIVANLVLDDLVEQLQRIQRFQEGVRERLRDLVEYVDAHR